MQSNVLELLGYYSTVELAAGVLAFGSALIGLFIAYQAWRGMRRNDSKPMKYLAIGLMLVFGLTYYVAVFGQAIITLGTIPLRYQNIFRLCVRALQFIGLSLIAYSLWLAANTEAQTVSTPSPETTPDEPSD
jgi:hypothetical protein